MLTDPGAYRVKLGLLVNGEAEVLEFQLDRQGPLENLGYLVFEEYLVLMVLLVPKAKWAIGERVDHQDLKGRQEISEDQDLQGFRVLEVLLEELESRE